MNNIRQRVGAMVAAIVGAGFLGLPIPGERRGKRNKVARPKAVTHMELLYAKFAVSAIERYAIGYVKRGVDGKIATITTGRLTDRDHVRRMRNARKQERQQRRAA